ncbi:MAG: tetratricopeptide repeat protein [Anaerolineae bacterium]
MKWTEQFAGLFRSNSSPRDSALREKVTAGRTAKFKEDYLAALSHFDQALDMARGAPTLSAESNALTVIALHRTETLARLRRFDEAAAFIETMIAAPPTPAAREMHIAYLECARGMLDQMRGDLTAARTAFEAALKRAKDSASGGAEGRALGHLGDLYLREGNASYAAHVLKEALPKLGASSDIELSGFFVGLLGQALTLNGQETEGLAFCSGRSVYQSSSSTASTNVTGDDTGTRALDEGRYLDARTYFQRTLHLFDPEKPTPAYVAVQSGLSRSAVYLRDLPAAVEAGEKAVAALAHLVDAPLDPPVALIDPADASASARGALGLALRASGRSAEAIPHLEAVLQSTMDEQRAVSRDQIDVLRGLAAAQADVGTLDAAVETYQRAISAAEKLDDPLEIAQCRRDLGLIYQRAGLLTQAVQEWTQALNIYEEKNAHSQIARLYCDLGAVRRALGQTMRSIKDYEQALMALSSVDGTDLETRGLVLSNAATIYAETGDAESADAFFSEAIQIAERMGDTAADSTRSGNYGWFLILVGRPRRAIASLERALRHSQTAKLPLQAAVQTDNLGLAYDSLGEYAHALEFHRKALLMLSDVPTAPTYWEASFKINLANTLLSLNELEEADRLIAESLEQARALKDSDLLIRALSAQGRSALLVGANAEAGTAIDEAALMARRIESKRLLADVLYLRSQQKMRTGYESAASAAWDEAHKLYGMLHMPQAKIQPHWLVKSS